MDKTTELKLRTTTLKDLETLFVFQLDKESNYLAAFTSKDPSNKEAYIEKWTSLLANKTINSKTILAEEKIVGSIAKFEMEGEAELTYWIGRDFWGRGIASNALKIFLEEEKSRPIYGRVAFDNLGSKRVLEKCGFTMIKTEKGYANAREKEIEEYVFELQ